MTGKEAFIKMIEDLMDSIDISELKENDDEIRMAVEFFEELKSSKSTNPKPEITENGRKLLEWMRENVEKMSNMFTSKEAAEALFTSGRSIAGSMRKLVNDGYVNKTGKDPVQYSLTDKGKNYIFDN